MVIVNYFVHRSLKIAQQSPGQDELLLAHPTCHRNPALPYPKDCIPNRMIYCHVSRSKTRNTPRISPKE